MIRMNLLQQLQTLTKENDKELLYLLLEQAESIILLETNRTYVPQKLLMTQLQLAQYLYSRMDSVGESKRVEGGIDITYITELPTSIQKSIKNARLVRCGGYAFEKSQEF